MDRWEIQQKIYSLNYNRDELEEKIIDLNKKKGRIISEANRKERQQKQASEFFIGRRQIASNYKTVAEGNAVNNIIEKYERICACSNGFGKIKTETTSNVYPSYNTQNEVDNFNSKINSIRDTYVNGGDIPLCGNALEEVSRNDNGNEFYTLETDENGNVYITDIKNITVYDIMNCPNKVNELYYLVTLM